MLRAVILGKARECSSHSSQLLLRSLGELPVEESGAKSASDRLRLSSPIVMAEPIVKEAQGVRQHPALPAVQGGESFDPLSRSPPCSSIRVSKRVERNEREQSVAQLRFPVLVDAPEALRV